KRRGPFDRIESLDNATSESWGSSFADVSAPEGAVLQFGGGAVLQRAHPDHGREGQGDAAARRADDHLGPARQRRAGEEAGQTQPGRVGARGARGADGATRGPGPW